MGGKELEFIDDDEQLDDDDDYLEGLDQMEDDEGPNSYVRFKTHNEIVPDEIE